MIGPFRRGPSTERLEHRAFEVGDAEVFQRLIGDDAITRYTGDQTALSLDEARARIAGYPDFDRFGFGRWACVLRSEAKVIGFSGLKMLPELGEVDVGYRFLPEYWGRGLATEAARAAVAFGFETLKLERIIGLVHPDNAASIHVLLKLGMTRDGTAMFEGTEALKLVIRRPSWAAESSGQSPLSE